MWICLCACWCFSNRSSPLWVRIRFSLGRWGSPRRCCTCLCSLRGPSLRPAARTPHRPRPNAGSHCWRRSRNSDQRPERWRWLLPVTHRGQTHWQLEHGQNWTNTCKCHRHLLSSFRYSLKLKLPFLTHFLSYISFQAGSWSIINSLQMRHSCVWHHLCVHGR